MLAQFVGIVFGLAVSGSIFINGAMDGVQMILPQMARPDIQSLISGTGNTSINDPVHLTGINQERLRVC